MSARSGKQTSRLLKRNSKSKATTNLPKLYHQYSRESPDHPMVDVNISSTNDLITNAFREMNLTAKENGEEVEQGTFILGGDHDKSILTDDTLFGEGEDTSPQYSDSDRDKSVVTSLLIPISHEDRQKNMIGNTSSTSLDSGVSSARASKRTSLEMPSPEAGTPYGYGLQYSHAQRRQRLGKSDCLSVGDLTATILEDEVSFCTTSKRPDRMSVDAESFNELLKAAIRVVSKAEEDGRSSESALDEIQNRGIFLKNSLKYDKRRQSHYDNPELTPPPQIRRKKSAEPILQRTSSSSLEPARDRSLSIETTRSRKMSACIICERKRLMSDNTASVMIKTTMGKNIQETRRFSEVLKVRV